MGLFITDQGKRSELQEKLTAELREKAARTAVADDDLPDGVDDSRYTEKLKKTTSLAWAWAIIGAATIGVIVVVAIVVS